MTLCGVEVLPASAPGSAGFVVSVQDVASTAEAFGRAHSVAAGAVADASGELAGCAAMAGDDPVLAGWRTRYQAVSRAAWAAVAAATQTLHDIGAKLVETGDAYLAADHASTPNRSGAPARLPPASPVAAMPAGPPSATGPTGGEVPAQFAEYWPGGDPVRLRRAGAAWTALASGLTHTVLDADRAFRGLTAHNTGPGFSAMAAFWSSRYVPCALDPLFNAAPDGAQLLGRTCEDLADLIELTRTRLQNAAGDADDTLVGFELGGLVPGPAGSAAKVIEFLAGPLVEWRYLEDDRQAYLERLDELTGRLSVPEEQRLSAAAKSTSEPEPTGTSLHDVSEIVDVGLRGSLWDGLTGPKPNADQITVTSERVEHILDGNATGGGHLSGAHKPGKSEFPPDWDGDRILRTAFSIARDPSVVPVFERRSYDAWKIVEIRDGVEIRVVVDTQGNLVTVVPLSGPGVVRNPRR